MRTAVTRTIVGLNKGMRVPTTWHRVSFGDAFDESVAEDLPSEVLVRQAARRAIYQSSSTVGLDRYVQDSLTEVRFVDKGPVCVKLVGQERRKLTRGFRLESISLVSDGVEGQCVHLSRVCHTSSLFDSMPASASKAAITTSSLDAHLARQFDVSEGNR